MKWLILASDLKNKDLKPVEDFLDKTSICEVEEFFFSGTMDCAELEKCMNCVSKATHCIIVDGSSLQKSSDYNFIIGCLSGKGVRTFIHADSLYNRRYEVLDRSKSSFLQCFDTMEDLLDVIQEDFIAYETEENQKNALVKLMTMGIPFTADSFAYYLEHDKKDVCELFFQAGMLMSAFTSEGVPLLCCATRSDCTEEVKWLLANGADINAVSKDRGYSAVMDAVWRKNFDLTKLLIKRGADLDFISSDGQPILVLAVGNGNMKIVKLLLESGADADAKDSMGMSAREYAVLFKNQEMIELMKKYPPAEKNCNE